MLITSREFRSKYYNGATFGTVSTPNENLAGSVMEVKQATFEIELRIRSYASLNLPFTIDTGTTTITRQTGSFLDDGFRLGDDATMFWNDGTAKTTTFDIVQVTATEIIYTNEGGDAFTDYADDTAEIQCTSDLPAFQLFYNTIDNTISNDYGNFIDDTTQGWYVEGMTIGGGAVSGTALGESVNKSWINGSLTCEWLTKSSGVYTFQVIHEFVIPYFNEGELSNIQTVDTPEEYEGNNSVKYIGDFQFLRTLTNPNSSRNVKEESILGAVGWFNEPFNGLNMPFSISNLVYEDGSLNVIDRIVADTDTVVKFTVNSTDSSFSAGTTNTAALVSKLPTLTQYQDKANNFSTNWLYDSIYEVVDTAATIGSPYIIQAYESTFVDANTITVEMTVNFPNVESTDNYLIAFEVATDGGNNILSDKTILIAGTNTFEKSADVPDLMGVDHILFELYNDAVGSNDYTDIKGWVEDDINCNFQFWLDTSKSAYLDSLDAKIVAYNTTEGTWFELESINFPLQNGVIVGGVQTFNLDTERGFNRDKGDYNIIKLANTTSVAPIQKYLGQISLKIDWQEWLRLDGADTVFYDNTKENNNLNHNASNYSLKEGYVVRILLDSDVSNGEVSTNYVFSSPDNEIYNYDLDDNGTPDISGVIETFNSASVSLGQSLLENETTTIKATWTSVSGFLSLSNYSNWISLEPINSPSKNTIKVYTASLVVDGSNLVGTYDLDSSELTKGVTYKISSRLKCVILGDTPIAKIENITFTGGVNGLFESDCYLRKADGTTALDSADTVRFELKDGGTQIELIEGSYGDDISTFTTTSGSPISSYTNFASGTVEDGGSISFNKKSWADANNLNYESGAMSGSDWVSEAIELDIVITAYDNDEGLWSANLDNIGTFERVVNKIEGNIFIQDGNASPLYVYAVYDNDSISETYVTPSSFELWDGGVLIDSSLPSFVQGNFIWGSREFSSRAQVGTHEYEAILTFANGMVGSTYMETVSGDELTCSYNRRLSTGNEIADTYSPKLESAVVSTIIQRSAYVNNGLNGTSPSALMSVFKNGVLDSSQSFVFAVTATVSETNWFNIDLGAVGTRNTIRYEGTESGVDYWSEFDLELNYIY